MYTPPLLHRHPPLTTIENAMNCGKPLRQKMVSVPKQEMRGLGGGR